MLIWHFYGLLVPQKYRSTCRGTKFPVTLFNLCIGSNAKEQHIQLLNKIRGHIIREEVQNEYHLPTSHTALKLHSTLASITMDFEYVETSKL